MADYNDHDSTHINGHTHTHEHFHEHSHTDENGKVYTHIRWESRNGTDCRQDYQTI